MPRPLCGDDPAKSMSISSPRTVTRRHDLDRLLEPVAPDLVPVDPIRQGADRLAQGALGAGDDLVGQGIDALQAELVHHRQQRPPADVVAGGLGVEIADRLVREADVGADDLQQLVVRLAAVEELRHRDAQPLLVDLVRLAREDLTADVRRVAEVAEVADDPALAEDRRDHREVVELAGGHPGVVGDQHVAGAERLRRIGGQQVAHAGRHRVDVPRRAGQRLRHHLPARVEDAAGEVLRLAHHRAEGGPHQRRLLLVGDGEEPVPEHFQRHRIEASSSVLGSMVVRGLRSLSGHALPRSPQRDCLRHRPTTAAPGPMTVVDSRSSTMAGPVKRRARSQPVAVVDGNVGHPALLRHVGPARAFARRLGIARRLRRGRQTEIGARTGRRRPAR